MIIRTKTETRLSAASLFFALWFVAGCGGDADTDADAATDEAAADMAETDADEAEMVPEGVLIDLRKFEFASHLAIDLDASEESETGLFVRVLEDGSGPATQPGDEIVLNYTVWLPDGNRIDTGDFPMVIAPGSAIDGFVEGATGMRLGERRQLVLPYDLAYGAAGRGSIPPYSPLVFQVELIEHTPMGEG